MKAGIPFWWHLVFAAARATLIYLGSKRFALLLIEVFCAVTAWRAYRAPQGKRYAAIRSQWMFAMRDAFIVVFCVSAVVFGYELMWNQPSQTRLQELQDVNASGLFARISTSSPLGSTDIFPRRDSRPICVQVLLPQGFSGGTYKLPFRPVAPSPPVLYNNGSPQRKGIDYTVSDNTVVVNFHPAPKDSLSVWYTTNDPVAKIQP
jgi:hypothetical protein